MPLFVLIGVLRGFPVAAYRRTPRRKPLCGLDQNKNCSFLNWTRNGCLHELGAFICKAFKGEAIVWPIASP
jgi:hypothetical protein